ncbi:MAG: hypothetical protein WCE64_14165, partial [Bacteroidales bacterium]
MLIIFLSSELSVLIAQTGPGGVGDATTNSLWLKADTGVYTDAGITPAVNGNSVQRWNDFSGNNNHANQTSNANKPIYSVNIVNNSPALDFDGSDFIDAGALGIAGTDGFSFIIVFKVDPGADGGPITDGSGDYIIDRTPEENPLTSLKLVSSGGNLKYGFQKRPNSGLNVGGPVSLSYVSTANFALIDYMRERGIAYRLFLNNVLEASVGDPDGSLIPPVSRIGRHFKNSGLEGYIAEVIVYNYRINNAQINIINSYLAAKYGLAITNDKYSFDATHKYEVAGIGRENSTNRHENATSAGI